MSDMTTESSANAIDEFIEELALALTSLGYSRMSARVLAAIMCTDDTINPTQADLAAMLDASPAAISTASRLLLSDGIIKKVSTPGERADRYQLNNLATAELAMIADQHRQIAQVFDSGAQLFEAGSAVLPRLVAAKNYHTNFANAVSAFAQFWVKDANTEQ